MFDEFFEIYRVELRRELMDFRKLAMFSRETFNLGLPARIYRTWAALLTQIQGGYAAEALYGRGNVETRGLIPAPWLRYPAGASRWRNGGICRESRRRKGFLAHQSE